MTRKSKRIAFIMVGILGLAVVATSATSCRRSCHSFDSEKMEKFVLWRVDDKLDDIDADDQQRAIITADVKKIMNDLKQMKEGHKTDKAGIIAELERGEPNPEKYHQLIDERIELMRAFAHRSLDTMLHSYAVLNQEQRSELAADMREHMEECGH